MFTISVLAEINSNPEPRFVDASRAFGDVQVLATVPSPPGFPEGIAVRGNEVYVALAAPFGSGISILRHDGTEETQLHNAAGSPIFPYDSPANIAFNKNGAALLSNHAFATGIPSNFTVLDVFVDDKKSPLVKPDLP